MAPRGRARPGLEPGSCHSTAPPDPMATPTSTEGLCSCPPPAAANKIRCDSQHRRRQGLARPMPGACSVPWAPGAVRPLPPAAPGVSPVHSRAIHGGAAALGSRRSTALGLKRGLCPTSNPRQHSHTGGTKGGLFTLITDTRERTQEWTLRLQEGQMPQPGAFAGVSFRFPKLHRAPD